MQKYKRIIIVESAPTDTLSKISRVLRKNGHKVILIILKGNLDNSFLINSYDNIISFNFKFFKVNIKNSTKIIAYCLSKRKEVFKEIKKILSIKPEIVIGRATPNWLCYLAMKCFRKTPFVYFPYDIRSFCYDNLNEANLAGVPYFEIKAERYCFGHSDGVIHKGSEEELMQLNRLVFGKDIKIRCPTIHFLPYCLKELIFLGNKKRVFNKNKEIHIVHVGHIDNGIGWTKPIKEIISQKIHVHLYIKNVNLSTKEYEDNFLYNDSPIKQLLRNPYLHLHESLDQKALSKEISKYNFGLWYGSDNIYKKSITLGTGNKIASYFEAGLPIIYFNNYLYVDKLMKAYNTGIMIDSYKKLKKKLNLKKNSILVENVKKARKDYLMEKHVFRLEKFFDKVIKYKKDKN